MGFKRLAQGYLSVSAYKNVIVLIQFTYLSFPIDYEVESSINVKFKWEFT